MNWKNVKFKKINIGKNIAIFKNDLPTIGWTLFREASGNPACSRQVKFPFSNATIVHGKE